MRKIYSLVKKYCTLPFFACLGALLVYALIKEDFDLDNLKDFVYILFVGAMLFGSIELLLNEYLNKWIIKRFMQASPIKEFEQYRFKKVEHNLLLGNYKGFDVLIGYHKDKINDSPELILQVLFNRIPSGNVLPEQQIKILRKKAEDLKVIVSGNSVIKSYRFSTLEPPPQFNTVHGLLIEMIKFLAENDIEPISYQDWINSATKLERYFEKISYE